METKDRVHVIHLIEALGSGGAERLLYVNLKHLDRARFQSTVVTVFSHANYWTEPIRQLGIRVVSLNCQSRYDLASGAARLWVWLRKEQPDLIHTHLWAAGVIGRVIGRLVGVPVISSIHNPDYDPEAWNDGSTVSVRKRQLARSLDRWTARFGCEHMVAVSEYVRQSTFRHLHFPAEHIDLLYNPIDVDELQSPPQRGRVEILRELGVRAESYVLLSVGRVTPQKGLLYAIRALPFIRERYREVHLLAVGSTDDQQWLARLTDEANSLGVAEHLHILGARRDIPDLLRACDLFVFPSLHEGLGIALVEAMAAGCACVATKIGPVPEVVRHGENGWLVPPRDAVCLANAVSSLLAEPAERAALGAAAAKSAAARFQPQAAAERLANIYESVLSHVQAAPTTVTVPHGH